jgi:TFIIF-interacting CTD phosphatase-like protein
MFGGFQGVLVLYAQRMSLSDIVRVQVRNLDYLNRDLSKVLLITANPNAYHLQPDNAIKVSPTI